MELTEYLRILRKYWVSITAVIVSGLVGAGAFCWFSTPTYTATTQIFLTVQTAVTAGDLNQGSVYAENQVQSYAKVAVAPVVLQPVIDKLALQTDPELLAKNVTATALTSTAIIQVSVVDTDAFNSARIANAIGRELISTVAALSPAGANGEKTTQATVIAPAKIPKEWTSPRVLLTLALGLLGGLLLGLAQAVVRARLDTRVVHEADVALVTDSSIVGAIEFDPQAGSAPVVLSTDSHSGRAEAYRRLRTNLQFLTVGGTGNAILITSSVPSEGKTTTAVNTAVMLAAAGHSVLLIDADLRRPSVAQYLNLEGAVGLTTLLIGRAQLGELVEPVGADRLDVLPAGQVPPNPSEMLGSPAMKKLLEEASSAYDFVIIDSPPLLPVTDAAILARLTGGALVVVGSGTVKRPQLQAALDTLADVEGTVLGLVLNKVQTNQGGYYRYQYGYRDGASASQRLAGNPGEHGPAAADQLQEVDSGRTGRVE